MQRGHYLFTSESVSMGHPDKLADNISDGVLDAHIGQDPHCRVACETLVTTDFALVAGEITSNGKVDYEKVVRDVIRDVGYVSDDIGFNASTCEVQVKIHGQSQEIAMGVDADEAKGKDIGAGDQGLMFGFACNDTPELMPLPIQLSHAIINKLTDLRRAGDVPWLRPDAKSQVTVEYDDKHRPARIHTIVVAQQHAPGVSGKEIAAYIREKVVPAVAPPSMMHDKVIYHINATGMFVIGGPHGDCGLTGRKIIVDTYGGRGRHGGGAFSGKDPTKVDRSACYMARHVAKNIVAAKLADQCEVQLAYVIGVAEPVSVNVNTFGTGAVGDDRLAEVVREVFPLTPGGIIKHLDLRRPIYRKTAAGGHFGRSEFPWESVAKAEHLRQLAGV